MSLCSRLCRFVASRSGFLIAIFSFLPSIPAQAEELNVYQDEYVIEVRAEAASLSTRSLRSQGLSSSKSLGFQTRLVRPNIARAVSSASSSGRIVPFNKDDQFCAELIKKGHAISCSPNFELKALATPNDPQFSSLWGLSTDKGINAPQAWEISRGSSNVVVAVIDTGIDYTHPDLRENMWRNPGEVAGDGVDNDNNGYVDDVHGINAITRSGDPMDDNGHGTHVAGTIGAAGNNSIGVAGVNWNVKLMGLKFLSASGSGSLSGAVEAINYLVAMKNRGINVRVVNNSWGGGGFSQALANAIGRSNEAGILFVAAAGNESNNNDSNPSYPASYDYPNVISVAAIDQNQNMAHFSNYGATSVDIAAPGVGILSTYPGNRYSSLSGTSMASPHVAGALGLLIASDSSLNNSQVMSRLYEGGLTLPTLNGIVRTGRKLNVARMIYGETQPVPEPTPTPEPCQYVQEQIDYAPDASADGAEVVARSDEFSFYQLDLPFSFTFFGQEYSSLYLSPNGVAYTGQAPTTMDYQNSASAPINSIAALHTDLTADAAPYGIRVAVSADKATVYWLSNHYGMRGQGDVQAHLSVYANGVIESFVNFSSNDLAAYVQQRATVGITGPSTAFASTVASNSSAIRSGLGVRYTPACGGGGGGGGGGDVEPPTVSKIRLEGRSGDGWSPTVKPGNRVRVALRGAGTGAVELTFSLDGKSCPLKATAQLQDGTSVLTGAAPRLMAGFKTLHVEAAGSKRAARISRTAQARKFRRQRRDKSERFASVCDSLVSSFN